MDICYKHWLKYCSKRMEQVNAFDEIETSKMMRDVVNRYFSIGRQDIYGMTAIGDAGDEVKPKAAGQDKYIQGWNVSYYMQPVDWGLPSRERSASEE